MQEFILTVMEQFGYLGVFLLIAVENIFPPIPSEVILLFGGFMTTYTNLSIPLMVIAATLGSLLGAIVLYYIGKILNKERLKKIVSGKIGKILRIKYEDIDKADEWFDTKGNKTVFFCRFIPIVRSLISIPAGMSEMPMGKFLLYTITGSAIWNTVLIVVGSIVGENWTNILGILDNYSHIVLIFLIIAFVVFVFWFYRKKMKKKEDNTEEIKEISESSESLNSDDISTTSSNKVDNLELESETANKSEKNASKKTSKKKKKKDKK